MASPARKLSSLRQTGAKDWLSFEFINLLLGQLGNWLLSQLVDWSVSHLVDSVGQRMS